MFDNCVSLTVGAVLTVLTWLAALALVIGGTLAGLEWVARGGLALTMIAVGFTVLQDNAKTRRVVRAVHLEHPPGMRSL